MGCNYHSCNLQSACNNPANCFSHTSSCKGNRNHLTGIVHVHGILSNHLGLNPLGHNLLLLLLPKELVLEVVLEVVLEMQPRKLHNNLFSCNSHTYGSMRNILLASIVDNYSSSVCRSTHLKMRGDDEVELLRGDELVKELVKNHHCMWHNNLISQKSSLNSNASVHRMTHPFHLS